MTKSSHPFDPPDIRLIQAAAWRVRLTEEGVDSTADFEAWLNDPANADAWRRVSRPLAYLSKQAHQPELVAIRQDALGHATRSSNFRHALRGPKRLIAAMAAVIVVGIALGGTMLWRSMPDDYRTGLGERRVVTLADGSKLSLDVLSEVTVKYTRNSRELHLLQGQARFDVAHDVERPFSVQAGNQKVIATGTAFNIDLSGHKVLVTLIEGHVVVLEESARRGVSNVGRPHSVELRAGQQLAVAPAVPPAIEMADIQRVTAWTSGQITFDNEPLSSVVERVNRYTDKHITIADPQLATMHFSGVLDAGDVDGFLDIVTHYLPVRATTADSGDVVLVMEKKS
jgi:transmembrane sensor